MREIQMHPPAKRSRLQEWLVVRRLQFFAKGAELLAWVGPEWFDHDGRGGRTRKFHLYDFATSTARELYGGTWDEDTTALPVSPTRDLIAFEWREGDTTLTVVCFEHLAEPDDWQPTEADAVLPRGPYDGLGGLAFAPDGSVLAVRNIYEGTYGRGGHWAPEVVRFEVDAIKTPVRYEEIVNPLTGKSRQKPIYDIRALPVMKLPQLKMQTIALSADGNFLAVGGVGADLYAVDLKRKKVIASFPWEGRFLRDGHPVRVGFDPTAQWVLMLTNGRLFARPLRDGKPWQTKATLGYVHDFAFHPDGRVLCAVFRDGEARYLDPLTGKVRQAFKWSKKPQPLYSVAFAPDGLTCAAGSENGKVIVWDVDA